MPTLPARLRALALSATTVLCACRAATIGEPSARFAKRLGFAAMPRRSARSRGWLWTLVFAGVVAARAGTYGDFSYTDNGGTVTIDGYYGAGGDVAIPAEIPVTVMVDDKPVTTIKPVAAIGSNAFYNRTSVTGITIPNSVTSIGQGAFYGCNGLTGNLTIGPSVTSIGDSAFAFCSGLTGNLTIGDSVTSIGQGAFARCFGLTGNLSIGNSVTSIGGRAFYYCYGLIGDLVIPDSVTSIGAGGFSGCYGLTGNLTIGNGVTSIGDDTFYDCYGLTGNLTIGNSVTSIGNRAFSRCPGLTGKLTIPDSVTLIGDQAFNQCSGLTGNLTIPNSVTAIGNGVFGGCYGLTGDLTIPDSVTSIGDYAFDSCSGLTGNLTIPNSVTSIGNRAFSGCPRLTGNLTISNRVTSIGDGAFAGCSGLTGDLTIPNSVTAIGDYAFQLCSGLTGNLTIPDSVTSIGDYTFANCSGLTGNLIIPGSVTSIGPAAFQLCYGLTGNLTIPNSVTSIGDWAFYQCSGLTGELTIPNSVVSIGATAFRRCSGLTGDLTIPNSVTSIGNDAFYECSGLTIARFRGNAPAAFGTNVFHSTAAGFAVSYESGATGFSTPWWNGYPCMEEAAPAITTQPQSLGAVVGQPGSVSVAATGATGYQWFKGGVAISGATGSTLEFASLGSADAGIYDVIATGSGGDTRSAPAVIGVIPAPGNRTAGSVDTQDQWQNIHHPSGYIYDQFLLSGGAGTFKADPNQIARCSFLDSNDSIVQVEIAGAGAITIVLDGATGPMAAALYNSSGIQFMKGKATIILAGADATTHFTISSLGTATNPSVTRPDVPYVGWADVAVAGIVSTDGKLGGIHHDNVSYNSATGFTGIYAPTVTEVGGFVVVHDIAASGSAIPYLYFGAGSTVNVKIAGGDLAQSNGDSITVSGLAQVAMGAGRDSCGRVVAAQAIQTALVNEAGADVTAALVVVAVPIITGVSPANGTIAGGTPVTITGTNLAGATSVTIGGVAATSVVVVSDTSIIAVTPAGTVGAKDVVVTAPCGSGTGTELFAYGAPPIITIQPESVRLSSALSVTLGVIVAGTDPLGYQWYRGDSGDIASPIVGATTLSLTTAALTNWARYWVRVTNPWGSADSATALVEVAGGGMTFDDWTAQGAGTPAGTLPVDQRAPLASPAGDGVSNLMKFTLGVPPLESAEAHLPELVKVTDAGVPVALALDFALNPHAQGIEIATDPLAPKSSGIRVVLEVSDNCVTWTEVASVRQDQGPNPDGTELVRLREAVPPAALRRFARLKVEVVP